MKEHSIKNGGPVEEKFQQEKKSGKAALSVEAPPATNAETKETTKTCVGKNLDLGITVRKVKFSKTAIDILRILFSQNPKGTISGFVCQGLQALLKQVDTAPVVHYMRLAGREIIHLRAILAEAQKILESFREDIMVARGTPQMLADLADKTEAAIDNVEGMAGQVAQHSGFPVPTADEVEQIKGLIESLEVQSECELLDDDDREKANCGIKYLKLHLPVEP